ncbi:MAG: hypothetical protein WC346_18605 [Methanogenium sp.]|jgi:hypothetical protein
MTNYYIDLNYLLNCYDGIEEYDEHTRKPKTGTRTISRKQMLKDFEQYWREIGLSYSTINSKNCYWNLYYTGKKI